MPLSFQQRIFAVLAALTAVPTILAVIGWALAARVGAPSAGARASLEQVASSARLLLERVDTVRLSPPERAAVRNHLAEISNSLTLARRAETYFRYYAGGFVAVIVVLGALVLFAAVRLAGHLSRQLSRPIDELVGWTRLIRRRLPLPAGPPSRGAPDFEALRQALRELAGALDIAVDQLRRSSGAADSRAGVAVDVLAAETQRLERLAHEFADFGRLPEGPQSEVDLVELLEELGRTAVPADVRVTVHANGGRQTLVGHYDPLRRAFGNLLRNAGEAMGGRGPIDIGVSGDGDGLLVTVADHGPGIPEELRQRVFEPYFTTKQDGTGLGLALVRQTLEAHRATVRVEETPGGGATFTIVFAR